MKKIKQSVLQVPMDRDFYKRLKIHCVLEDIGINEFVIQLIKQKLDELL